MKGKTNNPAGRPAGIPNKVTQELRDIINNFLNDNIEKVKNDFNELEPKDRVRLFIDLLHFAIPKYQSISAEIFQNNIDKEPHIHISIDSKELNMKTD